MTQQPLSVRVEYHFDHPAEAVFDAWLNASTAGKWLFRTADGKLEKAETDPRPGGKFEIAEWRGDILARHVGRYIEIDRPRRLVFEFAAGAEGEEFGPPTTVTVDFRPEQGGVRVTLSHNLDPEWADYMERTQAGWAKLLENLAALFDGEGRP